MRNIRQWDKVRHELYGTGMSYGKFEQFDDMAGWRFAHAEGDDLIYLESTGLKDKNGKEIYEGDVFKYESQDADCLGSINYRGCGFYIEWELPVQWGLTRKLENLHSDGEVIGNIYENPELLDGEPQ